MVHEDYREMLPALALSALDAEDAVAVNQHLSECAECRSELADWESTAAALSLSVNPAEPSAQVRARIMNAVRSEPRSQEPPSRVVPFPQTRREFWRSFGTVGAVAAAVLCLVLIIWIIVLWQQNRALRREMDFLARELRSTQEEAVSSSEFVSILSAPGAKVALLKGSEQAQDASAQFVYDRSGHAMLLTNGLRPPPRGKEYQLWYIVGKNPPIPGKTFAPDSAGRGQLADEVPQQALDSAVFAITLEPVGGSLAPTSAIYLRSSL